MSTILKRSLRYFTKDFEHPTLNIRSDKVEVAQGFLLEVADTWFARANVWVNSFNLVVDDIIFIRLSK